MPTRKTVLKWGGLVLGAAVALVLIAAGVLFYLVTRLDVRAEIERAVENATGRELTISGSVGVSFYPVLGLRAEDAALANVPGGRAPAFVAMDEIDVGVEIPPLFRRQVVVRQLVLRRPRIALEVAADGSPNWRFTPRVEAPAQPPAGGAPSGPPAEPSTSMTLQQIQIHDGEVRYYDGQQNVGWVVTDADLTTALSSLAAPMRVQGDVTYNTYRVALDAEIGEPRAIMEGRGAPLKFETHSDLLNATFEGQVAAAAGQFSGILHANGPNLRELASWMGSPIVGGVGLEEFAVSGRVDINGPRTAFSNTGFSLDHARGRGDFELSSLRNKPYLSGRVQIFDFDLNPYLTGQMPAPPADAAAPPGNAPPASADVAVVPTPERTLDVQAPANERMIDFSGLSAINADLEITTAALLVQHMRIDGALVGLVVNDGFMAATLHRVDLYGGHASGRMEIDAREATAPRILQDITIQGVDAERFLSDAANFNSIEGRAELNFRLEARGRNARELISNGKGRLHLEVVSGALRGVDLGGVSRTIGNALRGELVAPAARTPFQGFSATFSAAGGKLASENLSFNTPDLTIPGIGIVDLGEHSVEARLSPRSPRGGIVVPFTVRGPFTALVYNSDIRGRERAPIQARVDAVQAAAR